MGFATVYKEHETIFSQLIRFHFPGVSRQHSSFLAAKFKSQGINFLKQKYTNFQDFFVHHKEVKRGQTQISHL